MAGQLQVSVVEGKSFKVQDDEADIFVTLRLGSQKRETNSIKGDPAPRWLKDFKIPVAEDEAELKVFAFDKAHIGDGSIGFAKIDLNDTKEGTTLVKWYDLTSDSGEKVGELCMVLRFIKTRPAPVPAPAGADPAAAPAADAAGPAAADLVAPPVVEEAAAPATSAAPEPPAAASDLPVPAPPAPPAPLEAVHETPAPKAQPQESAPSAQAPPSHELSPLANGTASGRRDKNSATSKLIAAGGALVAVALATMLFSGDKRKPKYYQVQEGDTFCSIAGCYGLKAGEVIKFNKTVEDPDKIYPGDKIYIP